MHPLGYAAARMVGKNTAKTKQKLLNVLIWEIAM